MTLTNKEKIVLKGFDGILGFDVGGLLNAVQDGDMTNEEFKGQVTKEDLIVTLEEGLKEAYKRGYLAVGDTGAMYEAKHIKFLGNKRIKELMDMSSNKMMNDSEVQDILGK